MEELEVQNSDIGKIIIRHVEEEVQKSYLDYAMTVIVSRALPDVRDGLKPVHRRVLYAMHQLNLVASAKFTKSAAVVGTVMKDYHPHGDMAIYDTLVRMAQDFSMRYPLVDGQGNFGSIDGDSQAAMRYTECRMEKVTAEMLEDIAKDTVNWSDNYDGRLKEPNVLPAKIPQLLLNGSIGIAVGMATNIPPHNLGELCDAIAFLIDNPECNVEELLNFVKGPDFPTGGNIYDLEEIKSAYITGKGKIIMRAIAEIEEDKRGSHIIVSEIPYQVNKSTLVSRIADLVKDKKIEGVSDLRDESDRNGIRIVVDLKSNAQPKKILNQLFEHTPMQSAFHVNMLALSPELEPRIMTLKEILDYFIAHRVEVVTRRIKFDLNKAKERAHILEGLKIALDYLDEVINTIRKSKDREDAKAKLIVRFKLSDLQANAILDMRLSQLAALERQKIEDEYQNILKTIAYLEDLLLNPQKILNLIKAELTEIRRKYADERRTKIIPQGLDKFSAEDLIPDEQVVVTITKDNYVKRIPSATFHNQVRGGKGVIGMSIKEEDQVDHLLVASTHDDILFFTNKGRVFQTKVYDIPQAMRQAKGQALVNIIQINQDEKVTSLISLNKDQKTAGKYFLFATENGLVKKTAILDYANVRKSGLIAINLQANDQLRWVKITDGQDKIVEVSAQGQAIYYDEKDVRNMGRSAAGVRGMKLRQGDKVIAADIVKNEVLSTKFSYDLFIVTDHGFGKRTQLNNFTLQQRGGIGMRAANCTDKTGKIVGMYLLGDDAGDALMMSIKGQTLRTPIKSIKRLGRDTQGVTLIKLPHADRVGSVTIIKPEPEEITSESKEIVKAEKENKIDKIVPKNKVSPKVAISKKKNVAKTVSPKANVKKADKKSKPVTKINIHNYRGEK
jgi:DNA gyrase subunit A